MRAYVIRLSSNRHETDVFLFFSVFFFFSQTIISSMFQTSTSPGSTPHHVVPRCVYLMYMHLCKQPSGGGERQRGCGGGVRDCNCKIAYCLQCCNKWCVRSKIVQLQIAIIHNIQTHYSWMMHCRPSRIIIQYLELWRKTLGSDLNLPRSRSESINNWSNCQLKTLCAN